MRKDIFNNLFCLLFAIYFCIESYRYDLGEWGMPGPGYFPFGAALLFGIFSLCLMVKALRTAPSKTKEVTNSSSERLRWGIIFQILVGMFAYILLFKSIGFFYAPSFLLFCAFVGLLGGVGLARLLSLYLLRLGLSYSLTSS